MLIATASGGGSDREGKITAASVRLYDWPGDARQPRLVAESTAAPAPSFLAYGRRTRTLFVASETEAEGRVTAFALDGHRLMEGAQQGTDGNAAVHLALDQRESWLAAANYRAGAIAGDAAIALFPIETGGSLGPLSGTLHHQGDGPDRGRQQGPHTHCVMFSPDNRLLAAIDLGTDGLWLYRFDEAIGVARLAREVKLPSGSGPRHGVFHPSKPLVYICGELDSTLMTLRYDSAASTAELVDVDAATATSTSGRNYPSGVAISPDGHYLMLANRGADTIAVFWIDPETGMARLRNEVLCGGAFPRAIRLDRAGGVLAVANQKSGNIALFNRDFETGRIGAQPAASIELPSAMDAIFLDQ
ncbi:MAG: lactonase family protein [Rhizobium sp.]|nr:lactonase family protein [Rhizobium sp.]